MDALSLALPTAPIANPAPNGTGPGLVAGEDESRGADFAELLAAGLMPRQDAATVPPPAESRLQGADGKAEAGAAAADSAAALLAAIPHAAHAVVIPAADSMRHDDLAGLALAQAARPDAAMGQPATELAASAATIADAAGSGEATAATAVLGSSDSLFEANAAHDASSAEAAFEHAATQANPLLTAATEPLRAAQPTAVLEVSAPVQAPEFAQALSQQVVWIIDKDAQVAELRINPPELGPVEVRLHLSGDEASVQFVSAHAEVRNAIEAAIARLRESMAQAGIQLGEASVSAESFRGEAGAPDYRGRSGTAYEGAREPEPAWTRTPIAESVRRGLVDLFA